MTEIKHGNNEFYIEENGKVIGRIQYVPGGTGEDGKEIITVTHTLVDEDQNGRGLGKKLVYRIGDFAKEEQKLIIPACSFAKKVLERKEEYQDVLAE
ncbi:GNAT family N-acetyltransferase [Neobacillus piezotolerans]|uniref:GNAT family N-acetyltransferase n=1 Tax=Neobacillus piezotolerans TaxID=2259171 RepID=A0A3D8GMZ9_9BACI|nr:GNAT family N-acetyltransferase [Neobacillus piezotolerans]RDU35609.1 GNAT family N-acetyltransferase [Neobacillus piezotolerans]